MAAVTREAVGGDAGDPFALLHQAIAAVDAAGRDVAGVGDPDAVAAGLGLVKRLEGATATLKAGLVRAAQTTRLAEAKGERSTVQFLANELQMTAGEAKRTAELARSLSAMPGTRDALAAGEISAEQAHQITRAADRGILGERRVTEAQLLDTARRTTPAQLRDEIRRREAEADGDRLLRDQRRARQRRSLRTWVDPDGLGRGGWIADPVSHDLLVTLLDAFTIPDPVDTPDEQRRTPEQRRFDALAQAAQVALDAGEAATVGGVRPHVAVFVDHDTLVARVADGGHVPAETLTGPICLDTLRRHVCDADITRFVTTGESQVLDLGRSTREWNAAQRKALVAVDGHCRWPGCDARVSWCHIHHVRWWERDHGPTDLDNGVLLCLLHHTLAHEGGWTLTMAPATRQVTVVSPDGRTRLSSEPDGPFPRRRRRRRPPR